jgi:rhamnosyltransferase
LLGEGAFDGLDAVLKLHAKKSLHPKLLSCVGELWRQASFDDLAGSSATVSAAMARFRDDPGLGMLGPARLRVPNARYDEAAAWGTNRAQALAVAERLGLAPETVSLDYFAGTMFWVRPAMLSRLRAVGLRPADFAPGGLAIDGSLSHALERLLPALVKADGGSVGAMPPVGRAP